MVANSVQVPMGMDMTDGHEILYRVPDAVSIKQQVSDEDKLTNFITFFSELSEVNARNAAKLMKERIK